MASDDGRPTALPWSVLSSAVTYEDRWLKLRSDRCRTADGTEVAPFHVLEYPDWINVVPLTKGDLRLVLVREYRHGRAAVFSGLVGGNIERGDGAAEGAARRELREETGYEGGRFLPILKSFPNAANQANAVTTFLALDVAPTGARALDPGEAVDVFLDDLPDVLMRLRSGEMPMQAMHVAALWSAAAQILAGGAAMAPLAPLRDRLRQAVAPD